MNENKPEHPVVVVLALILLASAWLYLYTGNPADLRAGYTAATSETSGPLLDAGGRVKTLSNRFFLKHNADLARADQEGNGQKSLNYDDNSGIVSLDLIEAGLVDAEDAKVLNQATIRFAGSAAQASATRTGQ
jgi:hypothetical protein